MITSFIQLFLFFYISMPIYGMNKEQALKVSSMLNQNILSEKWETTAPSSNKPIKLKIIPQSHIDRCLIKKYTTSGCPEKAITLFEKIEHKIPYDTSILHKTHKKDCDETLATIEIIALQGNQKAQNLLTTRYLQACEPLFDQTLFLEKNRQEEIYYAFNFLKFLIKLEEKKVVITTSDNVKKRIIHLIDNCCPETKKILRGCRYLQAKTGTTQSLFIEEECVNTPWIDLTCKYLLDIINTQQFITSSKNLKKVPKTLAAIACSPLSAEIVNKLTSALSEKNNPLLPDIYYFLAILSTKNNNPTQANIFYTNIIESKNSYAKNQNILTDAIKIRLASIETPCEQDITYFTKNFGNIYAQLEKIDKTDPKISYNIALTIDSLLKKNKNLSSQDPSKVIKMALQHLEFATKNGLWPNNKIKEMYELCLNFHMQLAIIHENNNNIPEALEQLCLAIQYHSQNTNESQDREILDILTECKEKNTKTYTKHASLILTLLKYIYYQKKQPQNKNPQTYNILKQFAACDISDKLLPYLSNQLLIKNNPYQQELLYLLALLYEHKGDHIKAYHHINKVNPPFSYQMLSDKANIYQSSKKDLDIKELETLLAFFIKNKKTSMEQETISSIINQAKKYSIATKNYTLAYQLITKCVESKDMLEEAIAIAIAIRKELFVNKDPYIAQWDTLLSTSQLFKEIEKTDSNCYNSRMNLEIAILLMAKNSVNLYEKIIAHFTAGLSDKNLLQKDVNYIRTTCGILYYKLALLQKNHETQYLYFLDKATEYDNPKAQYEKACNLIRKNPTKQSISQAKTLLEEAIKQDCPNKEACFLELGYLYCNHVFNHSLYQKLSFITPPDIDKAITYLNQTIAHNENKEARQVLAGIYGNVYENLDQKIRDKCTDLKKAIEHTTHLIELQHNTFNNISFRSTLYHLLGEFDKELENYNLILNDKNLRKNHKDLIPIILNDKGILLFESNPTEETYKQAISCMRKARNKMRKRETAHTYIKINNTKGAHDRAILYILEQANHYIANNIMDTHAIECVCLATDLLLSERPCLTRMTITEEQKTFFNYLLQAAEKGNFDAQYTALYHLYTSFLFETDHFFKALQHVHTTLFNPLAYTKTTEIKCLLRFLSVATEGGIALAYYILCDYYKNDKEELEKLILKFSKVQKQMHYFKDQKTIQKIYLSCFDTFIPYVKNYTKNQKNASILDTFASITFASMQQYSNNVAHLKESIRLLGVILNNIKHRKSATYEIITDAAYFMLGYTQYKQAQITTDEQEKYDYLKESIKNNCLPAAHEMAQLWMRQQNGERIAMPIQPDDFFDALVQAGNQNDTISLDFLTQYFTLGFHHKINDTISLINRFAEAGRKGPQFIAIASEKNLIRHTDYKETSSYFIEAMKLLKKKNYATKTLTLLGKAITEEKHSVACIMLALLSLGNEVKKNYEESKKFSKLALSYGLVADEHDCTKKQFHNGCLLNTLFVYIESIIVGDHPIIIKKDLLSQIRKSLESNGINILDFYEVLKKISGRDLSSTPEWNN